MKISKASLFACFAGACALSGDQALAAPGTWSAPTTIAGDADVILTGTLVGAFNVGDAGVSAATVNGVTFSPFALATGVSSNTVGNFTLSTADFFLSDNVFIYGSTSTPFSTLSPGYQTLLGSATTTATPFTFTLTITGLTVDNRYQFQWFSNTSGPGSQLHRAEIGGGPTVALNDNVSTVEGGLGQYAVGTFDADASSQVITFSPNVGAGQFAQINGFQLRDLGPIPEPASAVLALLGLGMVACQRRRASA